MVAAAIIFLGAGTGVIASTVNPFATGVASDAAGISIGDGHRPADRAVVRARRGRDRLRDLVRAAHLGDPEKSVVGVSRRTPPRRRASSATCPRSRGARSWCSSLFGGTFLLMIYGFIPWNDLWQEGFGKDFPLPTFADFYFPEAAVLFLVMAVVIGLIARLGEEGTVTTIVAGAADFLGAGADHRLRARDHRRDEERAHDRHGPALDGGRGLGPRSGVFAFLAFIVNMPIAFLVPSSSGHAALVMPILAPLADFAGVSRAVVVTAFQSASGFVNLVTPTSAVIMGGLALSKVGYDRYLKFVWPYLVAVFLVCCASSGSPGLRVENERRPTV